MEYFYASRLPCEPADGGRALQRDVAFLNGGTAFYLARGRVDNDSPARVQRIAEHRLGTRYLPARTIGPSALATPPRRSTLTANAEGDSIRIFGAKT